ncbi:MAG: hypothetical protein IPM63_15195 [Acidobacteriota bacterium]|nr:MAG: hypothetical protein IPM63_15195 [Acidobacteriota bacterium]
MVPRDSVLILLALWALILLLSPAVLTRVVTRILGEGVRFLSLIYRVGAAATMYLVSGLISLTFLIHYLAQPDQWPKDDFLSLSESLLSVILVLVFGFCGWLGSVVVNEGFFNPFSPSFWFGTTDKTEFEL